MRRVRLKAFTLVELLVVVSIIALLLAILLPSLNKARAVARAVICSSNLKAVGNMWVFFANDNEDRGPGRGHNTANNTPMTWHTQLSFHANPQGVRTGAAEHHRPIQRFFVPGGGRPQGLDSQALGCPDMAAIAGMPDAARPWIANSKMVGGENWAAGQGDPRTPANGGPELYGKLVPNPGLPGPHSSTPGGAPFYILGTVLSSVRNPSYTYTVFDSARSSDDDVYRSGLDSSAATVEYPISGGTPVRYYAFRHPSLTGNYLFADGHVETLASTDETQNTSERFSVR